VAFDFHSDTLAYFNIQYENARKYLVPFVKEQVALKPGTKVLEIGCGEAGVLKAFTELGCICTGIELNTNRLNDARQLMKNELEAGSISFINRNIYDIDAEKDLPYAFDLIILKDVIEHIPHQEKLMKKLQDFMTTNGKVFFGFPPWQMPFGGHQQICRNKFLSLLPYFHLLPMPLYVFVLKLFGEPENVIKELREIKQTGISIERFERICKNVNYTIVKKKFYFINPIYEYKFKMKARVQWNVIAAIPVLRNFFTTAAYYLISRSN
jgi:2-polyprenyl-3-methyl-5-hydroxy-6-metoxy-1,4-benzoquinol methylase